ncbi:DUF397 domain-containing protein [Streptomyces apocyni]|uniref:DUF397 domain-containing protein n=1 Tax=Streptomyces apocyni TaxID=2654677 RepID=UPI0012E9F6BE|nr:DUF397 domain-containing protein [Streptomyces apocyni]
MAIKPSTHSADELEWFKSSYSSTQGPDCVEIATTPAAIHVRDSKKKQGHNLTFTPDQWKPFMTFTSQP